jgi:tetratricopeptide (TPR) repeat protein
VAANNLAMLIVDRQADDPDRLAYARELTEPFIESEQPVLLDTAGWVQYRSGNVGRSVELLEQASELGLDSPEHAYHLGMAYLAVDRIEEGQALLREAVDSETAFPGLEEARAALDDSAS